MSDVLEIFNRWKLEDKPFFDENYKDEVPQNILRWKSSFSDLLKNKDYEKYHCVGTIGTDGTFGFNEEMVNLLMHLAYSKGVERANRSNENSKYAILDELEDYLNSMRKNL